jgi:hypothetical protein
MPDSAPPPWLQAHCPQGSDLLSGLTALAQCWLAQGITGSFRQQEAATQQQQQQGSPAGGLDLAPWFDSLAVRLVILVSKGPIGVTEHIWGAGGGTEGWGDKTYNK